MLRDLTHFRGRSVVARNGDIGSVQDIYFDDEAWGVRYLVIDTGNWTTEGQVLISPYSVDRAEPGVDVVRVDLTRQQVKDSPSIDTHNSLFRCRHARLVAGRQGGAAGDALDRRHRLVCLLRLDVANQGGHQGQSRLR